MRNFVFACACACAYAVAGYSDDPQYGGLYFNAAVEIDGVEYPAMTTVYATSWPTQMVVRPILAEGKRLLWFQTTTPVRTTYLDAVQGSTAGAIPTVKVAKMDGSILFTPPYDAGRVVSNSVITASQVWWVDDDATDGDTTDVGSEEQPFHTIQHAIDRTVKTTYTLILVKPGIYNEGGSVQGSHNSRVGIPSDYRTMLRSTDGAEVTVIEGAPDYETYPDATGTRVGCGPNAYRCIGFAFNAGGDAAVQGFTLRNGYTNMKDGTGAWTDSDQGGGVCSQRSGWGISQHVVSDCIITNCHGYMGGAAYSTWLQRCKILGNDNVYSDALYGSRLISCILATTDQGAGAYRIHTSSYRQMPGFSYNCVAGLQRLGSPYTYYGTVSEANGKDGTPVGYTWSSNFVADKDNGDFRIVYNSAAMGNAVLPEKDTNAWYAWADAYQATCMGDYYGNRIKYSQTGVPWSGAVMEAVKKMTISVTNSSTVGVDMTGITSGTSTLLAGKEISISPNETGTRYADRIVVNGVTNAFASLEGGVWSYTIPDEFDMAETTTIETLVSPDWYVDAVNGLDANTGFTVATAKKTLAGAMGAKVTSGDAVHALPGTYDEGTMHNSAAATSYSLSRVVIPNGVTLESTDGPEITIIKGAAATEAGGPVNEYGCGSNAVRCVYLASTASKVSGFTLTGGRANHLGTDYDDVSNGGAVRGAYGNQLILSTVENCIVSNNFARIGGAGYWAKFKNCVIIDNYGIHSAGAGWYNAYTDCILHSNRCGNSSYGTFRFGEVINSTIGEDLNLAGTAAVGSFAESYFVKPFANNIVCGVVNASNLTATNCIFVSSTTLAGKENCQTKTWAEIDLDGNYRPSFASPAIDAGCNGYSSAAGDADVYGGQRVYNGTIDVGAVEADWRAAYAADVSKKGELTVTNASPEVVESASKSVSVYSGASVAGRFVPNGQTSQAEIKAKVAGTGTLTVKVDGVIVGTVTGPADVTPIGFRVAGGSAALEFSYAGEDGYAEILEIGSKNGFLIIFR